jgi:hypothetical protein
MIIKYLTHDQVIHTTGEAMHLEVGSEESTQASQELSCHMGAIQFMKRMN